MIACTSAEQLAYSRTSRVWRAMVQLQTSVYKAIAAASAAAAGDAYTPTHSTPTPLR